MADDRHAPQSQIADGFGHARAAFELNGATARFLHHARGVPKGDFRTFLIGAERHVDDHHGAPRAAHHGLAVKDHHLERDAERGFHAVNNHAKRVAHEHQIDMRIE